jgi:hypothetical protein
MWRGRTRRGWLKDILHIGEPFGDRGATEQAIEFGDFTFPEALELEPDVN